MPRGRGGTPAPHPAAAACREVGGQTRGGLRALAACGRGSRQTLSRGELAQIEVPVLVSVGTLDTVAGSGPGLAALAAAVFVGAAIVLGP